MGILAKAFGLQTLSETPPEDSPDFSAQVTPPPRLTSAREPMGLPAFYRGVVTLVNMASPINITAWRGTAPVGNSLVDQPDPWMSRRRFFARTIAGMVLHGNAYWRLLTGPLDNVIGLRCADRGRAYRDTNRRLRYQLVFDGEIVDLPASEVEHLRYLEIPGLDDGLGPVQACRAALEGIAKVRAYADQWFDSPDAVNGTLTTDQRITADDAGAIRDRWYDQTTSPTGGPAIRILGQGMAYSNLALNPADAQWLESQSMGVLDVARLLGLPADFLLAAVEGSSLTYSNLEMLDTSVVKRTLHPDFLRPIEEGLTDVIVRGQEARFDLSDFLRPDAKTRADIDAIYIAQKVYTAEYVQQRDHIVNPTPATTSGVPV